MHLHVLFVFHFMLYDREMKDINSKQNTIYYYYYNIPVLAKSARTLSVESVIKIEQNEALSTKFDKRRLPDAEHLHWFWV